MTSNPSGASVTGDRRRHARARRPARGTRVAVHKATLPAPPAGSGEQSRRRNQKDGAAWPRSLQLDLGCSLRRPATCQLAVHGSGPMSAPRGKLGTAISGPCTVDPAIRPRISNFKRTFHHASHPIDARRAAENPRHTDFSGRPCMLSSTHEFAARAHAFKCSEMEQVWRMRKKGG